MKYSSRLFINNRNLLLVAFLLCSFITNAQVGIGTTNPDVSSVLDVKSNTQGLLVPRMTSLQRENIVDPANSLLVYDLQQRSYFYYDSIPPNSKWIRVSTEIDKRVKRVLVKNVADFPDPISGVITLAENTLYEINGTINLNAAINLNNAYIAGQDTNEDRLVRNSGNVFSGNKGGSIRNITILGGGTAFNITGGTSLIIQNTIIAGMASVGNVSNVGMYFGNIVQFVGNTTGITYNNIPNLLLSNQGWFDSNFGTYETFTGSFGLIQKVSGFSIANGTARAMDFNSNPSVSKGVMMNVAFSGNTTAGYIRKYTTGSYPGYKFTNSWTVDCPGIPREGDNQATGDINFPGTVTGANGYTTSFNGSPNPRREKVWGDTFSNNLYRFSRDGNNKIVYQGEKKRYFQVNASLSYQLNNTNTTVMLYIAKNGVTLPNTKVYVRNLNTSSISSATITGAVELEKGDYIEVWAERISGSGKMFTVSLNLSVR